MGFFLETLIAGLMVGMLYALVALGFVIIYKASGVFNFAQGVMVLLAALAVARFAVWLPGWLHVDSKFVATVLAIVIAACMMVGIAWLVDRLVLRHLVNQQETTLLMATLGIAFILEGGGQAVFGSDSYKLEVGIPQEAIILFQDVFQGGMMIDLEDLSAAIIAAALVVALTVFFRVTATGRALRAVADDHQAAQSIGIPLNRMWVLVWSVAGIVALVAGVIWGSKLTVQFSLSTLALRALPVVIIGGFTSLPGAVVGGLLVGACEKLAEIYIGPLLGGGIEVWFAYVFALLVLVIRPQGLFGEKIIDRV